MARLLPLLAGASLIACANEIPTAVDERLLPVDPVTFEVRLPWSQFASDLTVLGGFGRAEQLGVGLLAREFQGTFDARTLMHLNQLPLAAQVSDSLGTTRTDSVLTFVAGHLRITLDTMTSTRGPVRVTLGRTLVPWDVHTATWEHAIDTLNRQLPWPEAGGGPIDTLGIGEWNEFQGDSMFIALSAAGIAVLADSTSDRGLLMSVETPGERVDVTDVQLRLDTRPSVHRDTMITLVVDIRDLTFIYNPPPTPPAEELRVGGVPSWRSLLTLELPETVVGPPDACARVGCPIALTAERVNHAGLVLTSSPTGPAFQPSDSLGIEVRAVLAPEVLPKSPLGPPLLLSGSGLTVGARLPASAFLTGGAQQAEIPITPIVQRFMSGETAPGERSSGTIALLSLICRIEIGTCSEVASISYASFVGPGQPGEPHLRLILTVFDRVKLP